MKVLPRRTVVIVGGGLAAGLVARQLVREKVDTVVIERGGDLLEGPEARLPTQRDELRWAVRGGLMQDAAVETYTFRHSRAELARPLRRFSAFMPGTGMGGAGNQWNGKSHRWASYNLNLRSRFQDRYGRDAIPARMLLQDWGITHDGLERYYDLFEKLFGVSGQAGNVRGTRYPEGNPFEDARSDHYPQRPLEETEAGQIFRHAVETSLGASTFPMPAANSAGAYVNPDGMRLGACQYCGHCGRYLCEANAKGTPAAVLYPWLTQQSNFEIRTHGHVLGLEHRDQQVTGVRYLNLTTGEELLQPAEVVVLAAFTLTNTRLLLSAGLGDAYDAATGRGTLGRNLCFQVNAGVEVFFRDRWINPFMGAGAAGRLMDNFNDDNFDHAGLKFLGGGAIGVGIGSGTPISSRRVPTGTPRWGSAWKQANADWYAHAFSVGLQGSCYPDRENFLDLDPDYTDAFGQPLVRITFDFQENERRLSEFCTARAEKIAHATGATLVGQPNRPGSPYDTRLYQGTHITGGTIMGGDPATGVVSPRLQHWHAENLFVAGSSVFPHNAGVNPSELIGALSLRLGDDLVKYVQRPSRL